MSDVASQASGAVDAGIKVVGGVGSAISNPIPVAVMLGIGILLILAVGIWVIPWIKRYLQKKADAENATAVAAQSGASQAQNQEMNHQVDEIFNNPKP